MAQQPASMKPVYRSRTVVTGAAVVITSLAAILVEVFALLDPVQMEWLQSVFGPTGMAVLGIIMIFLRVITTQPLTTWRVEDEDA